MTVIAALLILLAEPREFPDVPAAASQSEEAWLSALGYSPAAVKIIRDAATPAFVITKDLVELDRLRSEAGKGPVALAKWKQAEDAYLRKMDLEQARIDQAIIRQLKRQDRLLYLNQMRRMDPPPPLLGPAPPFVEDTPEQIRLFQTKMMERADADDARLRQLTEEDQLAFLIRLRSSPRRADVSPSKPH